MGALRGLGGSEVKTAIETILNIVTASKTSQICLSGRHPDSFVGVEHYKGLLSARGTYV